MATRRKRLLRDERGVRPELFWSRLPAFRAVAETEHVHRAAVRIGTTPSALSRSIKLLEAELGAPLFTRRGRSVVLTSFGRELLAAVRQAMRLVEQTTTHVTGGPLTGTMRVSSMGRLTTVWLLPALRRLRAAHPEVEAHVLGSPPPDLAARLLRGELDLAVLYSPLPVTAGLDVVHLGDAANGVYCGEGHPLFTRERVSLEDVLAHAFAAPEPREGVPALDGWPVELPRRIAVYSALLDVGIDACIRGELLAVLPDALAASVEGGPALRRLPVDVVPATSLYAAKRASVAGRAGAADALLAELRAEFLRSR